ncbi:MAG: hypothetical protein WD733_25940 [Bryobacterales bacterium]
MSNLALAAVLVWAVAAPGPRIQAASPEAGGQTASGTYRGRILTELFRHRQHQLRLGGPQRAALSAEGAKALREDIGNVAILEDTGGVVIQPNPFDLVGRSVRFIPIGSLFEAVPGPAELDQAARDFGVPVPLTDDDAEAVVLPFSFPFFGERYTAAFVHSDGNITFEEADAASQDRVLSRALSGPPRIAPYFSDLDPSRTGAEVSVYTTATQVVFTWENVPQFGQFGSNTRHTFQVVLEDSGTIEFHYEAISSNDAVTGVMPGRLRGEPTPADLSEEAQQTDFGALAEIFSPTTDLDVMAAAQRFYANHGDSFDFLVLFNNFSLSPGPGTFAFELNVRNEVLGIGDLLLDSPVIDFGLDFGSRRRLASFLNMGPLSSYPADPTTRILGLGENSTLSVMGQEAGHRFLAYVRFVDPVSGLPSRSLLGRDFAHWSFFFNSDASVVEGNRIEDRGAGITPRFLTVEAVARYSDLDQYIMGLRAPEEVPPSFLVANPTSAFSPSTSPTVGVSFNGDRRAVPVESIIAVEGPRVPRAAVSQKQFRFAFVVLVREGTTPSAADLAKVEQIRTQWETFFEQAVDHRGTADTALTKMLHLATWPAAGVLEGAPGTGQVEIAEARAADLDVMLSASSGVIAVPAAVTIPAGSLAASFPITPNAAGVAELTAAAAAPGFDTPHTLVAVSANAARLSLSVEAGDGQSGGRGALLPKPVVFQVKDGDFLHYSGVTLVFSANDDSVITPPTAVTDASGRAAVEWRLGSQDGPIVLTARLEQAPSVLQTATALVAGDRPMFSAAAVVNAANYAPGPAGEPAALSPGGLHSIFGLNLAADTAVARALPLPLSLAGTFVRINGVPAPLLFVSPGQINLQVPFELSGSAAEIAIETPAGLSDLATVAVRPVHPGIFFDPATGDGAILNADNTLVSEVPARPGETIQIFATGLGAVEPAGRTGVAAATLPQSLTVSPPRVSIGDLEAEVSFSGLAPLLAGVYQINAKVPGTLAPGRYVLRLEIHGLRSNEVMVGVQ